MEVSVTQLLQIGCQARLDDIEKQLVAQCGRVVQDGPFKWLKLASAPHAVPKILGTYEMELWPAIEKAIARKPDVVLNYGCGEGYYAVGLARRLPGAMVSAFDTDWKCREQCAETVRLNSSPVLIDDPGPAMAFVDPMAHTLIFMDCEGAELGYLSELACRDLQDADLIIECHDFLGKPITQTLVERLDKTHKVAVLFEGPRDTIRVPLLTNLGTFDRYLSVCEFRPMPMTWIVAWSNRILTA